MELAQTIQNGGVVTINVNGTEIELNKENLTCNNARTRRICICWRR